MWKFSLSTKTLFLIALITTSPVRAEERRFLAKKFSIPEVKDSHLIYGGPYQRELNSRSIKFLVWNLLKAERKSWPVDFKGLSTQSDILLLQEGYLNEATLKAFSELNTFRFDMGVSFIYRNDNHTPTGTIVGARTEPLATGFVRSVDLEPIIKTPKTITYAKYPIEGHQKELLVLSIHGVNLTEHAPFERQIEQAMRLIRDHDGPVVFAGDFNTRTKKRLQFLRDKMKEVDLKETAFLNDKRMKVLGNILDHAFIRGLTIREATVLSHINSSDHKPLFLDLKAD